MLPDVAGARPFSAMIELLISPGYPRGESVEAEVAAPPPRS